MRTFRHPLSAEEETRQIRLLREGSPEEAKMAREVLIEHNMRLVAHIVKKYQLIEEEKEDMISTGTIGLIKAINSFDEGKGRLATYACRCIDNEILMLLRSRKKLAREVSLYEPIGQDKEGNDIELVDVLEAGKTDVLDQMEERSRISQMRKLIDSVLTRREREIIILRYGLESGTELTQNTIAEKMGISRSYVSRIEKKALGKLRNGMTD